MDTIEKVIIIGGGPAGLAASLYTARANLQPLVFTGSPPGGQLTLTTEVENYLGFESILGPKLIETFRNHTLNFGTRLLDQNVLKVDFLRKPFSVMTSDREYQSQSVILATGAKALWLGLESETRLRGKGVSACATCDGFFFKNKVVGVVGGGDTALEEALTLSNFASRVYIIHRRDSFRASKIMQDRIKTHPKIHILYNARVTEVMGNQKVEGVTVKISPSDRSILKKSTEEVEKIAPAMLQMKVLGIDEAVITGQFPLDGLFIAIGHKPDTELFKNQIELDEKGYIRTFARAAEDHLRGMKQLDAEVILRYQRKPLNYSTATSVEGVFAAGDNVDYLYRQAATAVGMGVEAALDTERYLELAKNEKK